MMMKEKNDQIYRATRSRSRSGAMQPVHPPVKTDSYTKVQARRTLTTLAVAVLVFLACSGLIYFKCLISATQMEISRLHDEIDMAKSENSRLEAVHTEAINLDSIRLSAQQLGMGYPDNDQIRYFTIQGETMEEESSTSLEN